jgi:hypothetical protein
MQSTWESRELPVLRFAVEQFDDPDVRHLRIADIVAGTGLDEREVKSALLALHTASPPYVEGLTPAEVAYPIDLYGVTERARRVVGQWPTPEAWADRLVAALEQAAQDETDPRKRGLLRKGAGILGGVARDVVVKTALGEVTGML